MKTLKEEFQMNADMTGVQTFKQIKRTPHAAIYQRIRHDGTTHSFEAFRVKVVKAGTKMVTGDLVLEDYEPYPRKGSFGRIASSCKTLEQAEKMFAFYVSITGRDEINGEEIDETEIPGADVKGLPHKEPTSGKTRGRKAIDRSIIVFPKEKFTMKQFSDMNPDVSQGFLYLHLQTLIDTEYQVVGRMTGGRGKPTLIYDKIVTSV
jgi:hypothetical protein